MGHGVPGKHSCRAAIMISGVGQTQFEMKAGTDLLKARQRLVFLIQAFLMLGDQGQES